MATVFRPIGQTSVSISGHGAALIVLLAAALFTRAIWFGDPVSDFDEQLYSFIGWRMTQGDLPYADYWDRKPFGLFLIFAISHWFLGPEPIAYQLPALVSAFGGAWLVYLLSLRLVDRVSATIAGTLYLILLALYGSHSGQTEVFHSPLMLLALWLLLDWNRPDCTRRALLAMLACGIALQIKYTVLPQCVFLGVYALYGRWRMGAELPGLALLAAAFAVLGVLPTALVALWYVAHGEFQAFWFANFVSFFDREPSGQGRFWQGQLVRVVPIAIIPTLGIYAAFRLGAPRDWRIWALYVGWALSACATVLLPATTYIYYFGALAAPVLLVALPLIDRRSSAGWVPAALLVIGMLWSLEIPDRYSDTWSERRVEARLSKAIAPYVGQERNCLYVYDGPTALYRTTGSCALTRFVYPDHLNNSLERNALGVSQTEEIRRILTTRPGAIVTANFPVTFPCYACAALVEEAVRNDYHPLISVSLHGRTITAWARRDLSREGM